MVWEPCVVFWACRVKGGLPGFVSLVVRWLRLRLGDPGWACSLLSVVRFIRRLLPFSSFVKLVD